MTEKSARDPTPGSFPHTGSAPAAPPVRGQRGATSAERGAEPRGRGAAAEAPAGLRGGGGAGEGGGRAAGRARLRPLYDRSWRADRGGARPARRSAHNRARPRSADGAAAGSAALRRAAGGGEAPSGDLQRGKSGVFRCPAANPLRPRLFSHGHLARCSSGPGHSRLPARQGRLPSGPLPGPPPAPPAPL
ncbi:5E5 antigen-like isoform X2 [Manacus candei]|uniref:5E5 antigen-like isoform X2 n=1 Tax=Manacus candei TaxID=415023 RepID=UPI0022275B38|nr:5E5 antigen-like isoform X2 [Manacus candei]